MNSDVNSDEIRLFAEKDHCTDRMIEKGYHSIGSRRSCAMAFTRSLSFFVVLACRVDRRNPMDIVTGDPYEMVIRRIFTFSDSKRFYCAESSIFSSEILLFWYPQFVAQILMILSPM